MARPRAFSLVELLVVMGVVAVLLSLLAPALAGARGSARAAVCLSNQRQLGAGWALYAADFKGLAMPAGDDRSAEVVYWWGSVATGPVRVEHERGFLAPYLDASLSERGAYECPAQAWGSYRAQPMSIPAPGVPTSTYGYNGYGLTPPMTPGWRTTIGAQRWVRLADIERPAELFIFADAMLGTSPVRNDALLDPPRLYSPGPAWAANPYPTTCFRHAGSAGSARGDGGARMTAAERGWLTAPALKIGSAGTENDPHYIQDWLRWR